MSREARSVFKNAILIIAPTKDVCKARAPSVRGFKIKLDVGSAVNLQTHFALQVATRILLSVSRRAMSLSLCFALNTHDNETQSRLRGTKKVLRQKKNAVRYLSAELCNCLINALREDAF